MVKIHVPLKNEDPGKCKLFTEEQLNEDIISLINDRDVDENFYQIPQ